MIPMISMIVFGTVVTGILLVVLVRWIRRVLQLLKSGDDSLEEFSSLGDPAREQCQREFDSRISQVLSLLVVVFISSWAVLLYGFKWQAIDAFARAAYVTWVSFWIVPALSFAGRLAGDVIKERHRGTVLLQFDRTMAEQKAALIFWPFFMLVGPLGVNEYNAARPEAAMAIGFWLIAFGSRCAYFFGRGVAMTDRGIFAGGTLYRWQGVTAWEWSKSGCTLFVAFTDRKERPACVAIVPTGSDLTQWESVTRLLEENVPDEAIRPAGHEQPDTANGR